MTGTYPSTRSQLSRISHALGRALDASILAFTSSIARQFADNSHSQPNQYNAADHECAGISINIHAFNHSSRRPDCSIVRKALFAKLKTKPPPQTLMHNPTTPSKSAQ